MANLERDPHTGYTKIGHDWNGITELNRPVPKPVWFFLITTFCFSVIYWILMPAWPGIEGYTRGVLGVDQRDSVAEDLAAARAAREAWTSRVEALDFAALQADESLMEIVRNSGRTLFDDNCAVCHGQQGQGGSGFPSLTDDAWLWGGAPEAIAETLRVGINSTHPETRVGQMPAFGRDLVLGRDEIRNVVSHVRGLAGLAPAEGVAPEAAAAGAEVFAANCAVCHGDDGTGNTDLGAPNLTDGFWIYGSDRQTLYSTIHGGRQGHMPHWEGRLSALERKILALFVIDLGAAAQ